MEVQKFFFFFFLGGLDNGLLSNVSSLGHPWCSELSCELGAGYDVLQLQETSLINQISQCDSVIKTRV